jgi:RimJ/RimL family protein N-acetyltransferase
MPGHVFLEGPSVALRTVEQHDRDRDVLGYVRNEPTFRRRLGFDEPWPDERVEAFVASVRSNDASRNFFVCLPDDDRADGSPDCTATVPAGDEGPTIAGAINLFDVDRVSGTLSYWLFEPYRGNGYATEAAALLLDYAFDELGLHRVEAETFGGNDTSRALLERLEFVHEGTSRECRIADGEYGDVHRFGLLEDEWTGAELVR